MEENVTIVLEADCVHPPRRLYSWLAFNHETDKSDILCVGCFDCGIILMGEAEDDWIDGVILEGLTKTAIHFITADELIADYENYRATEQD